MNKKQKMFETASLISDNIIDGFYMQMAHLEKKEKESPKHKGYDKILKFLLKKFDVKNMNYKLARTLPLLEKKELIFEILIEFRRIADERHKI